MIYTSYYANRNIPNDFIKIGISIDGEKMAGIGFPQLAPDKQFFRYYKDNPDNLSQETLEKYYTLRYNLKLKKLNPKEIAYHFKKYFGENVVLLCYEGKDKFCHRHLVRKWFNDNGIECEEFI